MKKRLVRATWEGSVAVASEEKLIWDGISERFVMAVNALEKAGHNPTDIRIVCGIKSPATWSTYITGRTPPPLTVMIKLMNEFGVDTAWLMANKGLHNDEAFKAKLAAWLAEPKLDKPKRGRPRKLKKGK